MTYNDSTNEEEAEANLRVDLALELAIGFKDDDDIVHDASGGDFDEDEVWRHFGNLKRAFDIERADWPAVTDCDRLDNAMIDLDRAGIFSRHCLYGGFPEMMELTWEARLWGRKLIGHVTYSLQAIEEAIQTGTLALVYHSNDENEHTATEIVHRIMQTLSKHGLTACEELLHIEVSLHWQRRALPATSSERWTPQLALEHWCREIGDAVASWRANQLGVAYGQALAATGYHEQARTWAHALSENRHREMSRTKGLRAIAMELLETEPAQARCLLAEAYSVAPYGGGDSMALLQLLIEGDLFHHAEVREAARVRVLQARRDMLGAAEMAWYLVRVAPALDNDEALARHTSFATWAFESPLERGESSMKALRVAAAAGLWVVHTRAGKRDLARAARDVALKSLKSLIASKVDWRHPIAAQALAQAAIELDAFNPSMASLMERFIAAEWGRESDGESDGESDVHDAVEALPGSPIPIRRELSEVRPAVRRALLRSGHIDAARRFEVPSSETAAQRRAQLETTESGWVELYEEGLVTDSEVESVRLELAVLRAKSGDHVGARQQLALVCNRHFWDYSDLRDKYLAGVVATGQRHIEPDTQWFTPAGERKLTRALNELKSRPNAISAVQRVFEAAAAFAHRGDSKRARDLLSRVESARYNRLLMDSVASEVRALVYLGEIERARELVDGCGFDHGAAWPLIVYLAEHGERDQALEYLGRIAERSVSFSDLLALAPAIVAIAPEPVSFAATMSKALDAAYAGLASLRFA